jgi:diacylglycerol kinase (ATP)
MQRNPSTGPIRIWRAFRASFNGYRGALRRERAFREELVVALVVIPMGLYFGRNGVERALLVGPMVLVLVAELLNSAIETTVDRVGLERHELSGLAKDLGSAAVLTSFLLLGLNWVLVLWF